MMHYMEQDLRRSIDKPCVILMGEFSAGKSTILNTLIGKDILPTKVTATELPPVWFSYGEPTAVWIDSVDAAHQFDPEDFSTVPADARQLRISMKADILRHCDIVDTPGISDPNLSHDCWGGAVSRADMILWCSTATQAWRESERSMWTSLPERLREHSLLVVTRADKLVCEADRDKVARRLQRETSDLFAATTFVSASDALRAKVGIANDASNALWSQSGGSTLLSHLYACLKEIQLAKIADQVPEQRSDEVPSADRENAVSSGKATDTMATRDPGVVSLATVIRPRRVQPVQARRIERPAPGDRSDVLSSLRLDWLKLDETVRVDGIPPSSTVFSGEPDIADIEDSPSVISLFEDRSHDEDRKSPTDSYDTRFEPEVENSDIAGLKSLTDATRDYTPTEVVLQEENQPTDDVGIHPFAPPAATLKTDAKTDRDHREVPLLLIKPLMEKPDSDADLTPVIGIGRPDYETAPVVSGHQVDAATKTPSDAVLVWREIVSKHEGPLSIVAISSMIEQLLTKLFDDTIQTESGVQESASHFRESWAITGMDALNLGVKGDEISSKSWQHLS